MPLYPASQTYGAVTCVVFVSAALPGADIDQRLLKFDDAVDMALNRAKAWSKYAKDIAYYVDKRASMEAEFAKSLAKLAHTVQPTIAEDAYLPFQSIFCTALGQDMDYASKCQATYQLIQAKKFVEPLNARRVEHDKTRKVLKDQWTKETRKLVCALCALFVTFVCTFSSSCHYALSCLFLANLTRYT